MLRKLMPHAAIILSLMYLIFYAIDRVNPVMAFIDNEITKALLVGLGLISIADACLMIADNRARVRRAVRRQRVRAREKRDRRERAPERDAH